MSDGLQASELGIDNPEQVREKALLRLKDPNFLPTHDDIAAAFKDGFSRPESPWWNFVENQERPVYELLNREFIQALSSYLRGRAAELGATSELPITVLEVGAGNGRLSHFLNVFLPEDWKDKVKIIATDSNEWNLANDFPVTELDYAMAIDRYKPAVVIASWMPRSQDWTPKFRDTESVQEYIMIGNDSSCGTQEAWGMNEYYDEDEDLYKGFERIALSDLSRTQICKDDSPG